MEEARELVSAVYGRCEIWKGVRFLDFEVLACLEECLCVLDLMRSQRGSKRDLVDGGNRLSLGKAHAP